MNLLADRGSPPVQADAEPTDGLGGQAGAHAAGAGRAMADATADIRALEPAAETWRKMRITRRNLRHEAPPAQASPGRGMPAFISPLRFNDGGYGDGADDKQGRPDLSGREGFGGNSRRNPLGNGCGASFLPFRA